MLLKREMEFLQCKICSISYDEEEHKPRHAPCGHELCTACVKALIKDSILECPRCRQKNKVYTPEDLPLSYGLIDVIRAFKTMKSPLTKETKLSSSGATNDEVCNIHCKSISHWCFKCQMWICEECLDSHSTLIGCSTAKSSNAMKSMKEEHIKQMNILLSIYEKDASYVTSRIQECADKRKEFLKIAEKLEEEEKSLGNLIQQGESNKENLVDSKDQLNAASSPREVSDRIKLLTQRKQTLRTWLVKNLGADTPLGMLKTLKDNKDVYAEMVIKNETMYGKFSQKDGAIYFHTLRTQVVADSCIIMPFNQLQKWFPDEASLIFLEMSNKGVVKGRVLVRLDKKLPNIKEHVVQIVTGQHGISLRGVDFKLREDNDDAGDDDLDDEDDEDNDGIYSLWDDTLPFTDIAFTSDDNGSTNAKRGDVLGCFREGYFQSIGFYFGRTVETSELEVGSRVFGNIENGLDIMLDCYYNYTDGVEISDCGLVIELE